MVITKKRIGLSGSKAVLCDKKEISLPNTKLCNAPSYDTEFFYYTQVESEWYALKKQK